MYAVCVAVLLLLSPLLALIALGPVTRTVVEDRTLLGELDGYQEYARRVQYRLLPGVW